MVRNGRDKVNGREVHEYYIFSVKLKSKVGIRHAVDNIIISLWK